MLSMPHRGFYGGIVSGLSCVRAYPRRSLKTARFNASHLRPKPHIQEEIARLRAQADAITGPAILALIEKRGIAGRPGSFGRTWPCSIPKLMVICWSASRQ